MYHKCYQGNLYKRYLLVLLLLLGRGFLMDTAVRMHPR